ncbi:hypothetical protein N7451_011843 [Penicillium sp. IBT 35674x]|nr:hypothetical protein N7451_011843 [Penicillium sp. IBT 35674x]
MLSIHPFYWSLIAVVLAIVHPAASQPVRTPKWIETFQFEDLDNRGIWKVFEKHEKYSLPELPQAKPSQPESPSKTKHDTNLERGQGLLYKRETTSDKSIVSVLIPRPPISERLDRHWKHPQAELYDYPWKPATPTTKHYGEVLGHNKAKTSATGSHGHESESSSSSLGLSSGDYISFLSYRISFPFLKFTPVSFAPFPLPGMFTTIMVLLALVWIAILIIGLVEVGNYLWSRGQASPLAGENDEVESGDDSAGRSVALVKEPFQILVIPRFPRCETAREQNEDEVLSSSSETDSEFESETNYRLP